MTWFIRLMGSMVISACVCTAAAVSAQLQTVTVEQKKAEAPAAAKPAPQPKAAEKKKVKVDVEKQAKEVVAKRRVVRRRAELAIPANVLEPQVKEYTNQFRSMMKTEYHFARLVCDLNQDQRKAVARESELALRAAARKFTERLHKGGWQGNDSDPDPRKLIEEGVSKGVLTQVTSEQADRYRKELSLRTENFKRVAIRNIVAQLDQDLVLSPDQRGRVEQALVKAWKDSWCRSTQYLMNLESFFPAIPDAVVAPHLSEVQKAAWGRLPKNNVQFGWGGMMEQDNPKEDPELIEARKEADEKEAGAKK